MSITKKLFDKTADGRNVTSYTMTNVNNMSVEVLDFGGIIRAINFPDKNGKLTDVVIGFDTVKEYTDNHDYFGAIIGRYCNRITNGQFELNGKTIKLNKNDNGRHTLHGGFEGFDLKIWDVEVKENDDNDVLELSLLSPDGEENFPGNLSVKVKYTLFNTNKLSISYEAESDKDTVINMTNHSYFNLSGHDAGFIGDHIFLLDANEFTPCDDTCGVTGEIKSVDGTLMDLRLRKPLSAGLLHIDEDEDLKCGNGYDHNYILNKAPYVFQEVAKLYSPVTGIKVNLLTDQPGIQIYSGNFIKDGMKGKGGATYVNRGAVCLETQHYPDSVNHPEWPDTTLKAGEKFKTTTEFQFMIF